MTPRAVVLLTTGGTLATVTEASTGRSEPRLGPDRIAALASSVDVAIEAREIARVPSWQLDPAAMSRIATLARDAAAEPGVSGVVVTHGTTTLEYTAFLTDLLLPDGPPVVFTGAMRRADDPDADGPGNLRDALRVAASPDARDLGALVVFAGRVLAAGSVWKADRVADDAFIDLAGDVGAVSEEGVRVVRRPARGRVFDGRIETAVGFVKAVPGADGGAVDALMRSEVRGLVVEGLPGVGGIPPLMHPAVIGAARRVPVVVASRAPHGALPAEPTGGTGEPLKGTALLSAGRLTAEQAYMLLMAVLGEEADAEGARAAFTAAVRERDEGGAPQRTTAAAPPVTS
jgi:L-asparaginase